MFRIIPRSIGSQGTRCAPNWFLAVDRAEHPLLVKWLQKFNATYAARRDVDLVYFAAHEDLCTLIDTDPQVREAVETMPVFTDSEINIPQISSFNRSDAAWLAAHPVIKRPRGFNLAWYAEAYGLAGRSVGHGDLQRPRSLVLRVGRRWRVHG